MLFQQNSDSFIRAIGPYGYIVNQTTKHDRLFNESGREFLLEFSRSPKRVEDAVRSLAEKYVGVNINTIKRDFLDFVAYLEKHRFVITGNDTDELQNKDIRFTYSLENPKTFTFNFQANDDDLIVDDTQSHLDRYLHSNPTLMDFQMEVTSRCNERCVHCYIPHSSKNVDIDYDLAISAIDQAAAMGIINMTFSGGEATLFKQLPSLIKYARKKDLSITLLSNLVNIPDELFESIVESHLNLVQVSVYSLFDDEHDAITKLQGSLQKTLANIERLINADVPIQVSCPIMKINYKSYKNVLKWAYDHKVKAYTDFILMARTDGSTDNLDMRIKHAEAEEMLKDILKIDEDYRVLVSEQPITKLFMDQSEEPVCGVGINTLCMVASGACYPCAGWQGFTVGNIATQSLRDIWTNSKELIYLRSLKRGNFPKCMTCQDQNYCAMCMVRNFNETGDIFSIPNHFCSMAALNRRIVEEQNGTINS